MKACYGRPILSLKMVPVKTACRFIPFIKE